MYGHGHSTGTKAVSRKSQNWYDQTAQENIERLEREDAERALATALATQVGNAVTAMPEAASRITKAATLVQAGDVYPLTSGNFLVGSQTDTQAAHLVQRKGWHCDCADHVYRKVTCKHILAAMMTVKIGAAYHANYTMPEAA